MAHPCIAPPHANELFKLMYKNKNENFFSWHLFDDRILINGKTALERKFSFPPTGWSERPEGSPPVPSEVPSSSLRWPLPLTLCSYRYPHRCRSLSLLLGKVQPTSVNGRDRERTSIFRHQTIGLERIRKLSSPVVPENDCVSEPSTGAGWGRNEKELERE